MRAAARQQELTGAQSLEAAFTEQFLRAHLQVFPPAQPPVVPPPPPVDHEALRRQFENQALGGISRFKLREREQARADARQRASYEAARQAAALATEHERQQAEADRQWHRLIANDPDTVIHTLEAAFEEAQMPAAPLDCAGSHATVLVRTPPVAGVVPEQQPALTPTGRPTMKRRTKSEINRLYIAAVLSHSLAAEREALASCPAIAEVSVIVFSGGEDATEPLCPISVMRIDRPTVDRIPWANDPDAAKVALSFERLMLMKGQASELSPLSLVDEEPLHHLLDRVAEQLGVPVDPRCKAPLAPGQVQHFAPVRQPR